MFTAQKDNGADPIYVTVVARVDVQGNPRKLYASVTSALRLDVAPRLELIDAVDANGDGIAELLFRSVHLTGAEWVLFHVGPDSLTELFRGGAAD